METKPFILIVDDVPKNLQVLGSILYDNGYEIAMADNGPSALKMLEDISPDLILLDVMMPEMDGYEVCAKLKKDPKLAEIPVIFLTAKSETNNIIEAFKSGAVDYITKPFNSLELLSRVNVHIQLKRNKEELKDLNNNLEKLVAERTEQLKIANDKLAKLDNAKSYFLGLLSHELNTPISGIIGSVDLLKSTINNEEDKELLDIIANSTQRLKKFSEEALLITRLRTDKYEKYLYSENICKLCEEVVSTKQDLIKEKNIKLEKSMSKQEMFINLDYGLAKKCLDIIIDNAIKYTPEGGTIYIKLDDDESYAYVNVNNTGNGFPDEVLVNPFNFFVSDEIMHHSEGYGLGLAIAELIMNAHSGKIKISNNNIGANVELKFPIL